MVLPALGGFLQIRPAPVSPPQPNSLFAQTTYPGEATLFILRLSPGGGSPSSVLLLESARWTADGPLGVVLLNRHLLTETSPNVHPL